MGTLASCTSLLKFCVLALLLWRATKDLLCSDTRTSKVAELDISGNAIRCLDIGRLPTGLKRLTAWGNQITFLPNSLVALPTLEHLILGGNRLDDVNAVFLCPSIQHANFSFNLLSELRPHPASVRPNPYFS